MFRNSEFELLAYLDFAGKASGSGDSLEDPKQLVEGENDLKSQLEEGCVVTEAYVHVLEEVTGSTQLDLGDASDSDAYIATAALNADSKSADTLNVRYEALAQPRLTVTGAPTAGKLAVVIKGHRI